MKNALIGYTFQKHVTELLLVKMDVERDIDKIEIETENGKDFDDVNITVGNREYFFQIKDYAVVDLQDIVVSDGYVRIKGIRHNLTDAINILFIKDISITPNCEVLGFSAFKQSEIYIISSNRSEIDDKINNYYKNDISRKLEMESWFDKCLDDRKWIILRTELPSIKVFSTELREMTIDIGREHFKLSSLLLIEGNGLAPY